MPPRDAKRNLFGRPEYELPDLPPDVTLINDSTLMSLFAMFTEWMNYAATRFAEAEVEETRAEANQRHTEAVAMTKGPGGKTVTEQKANMLATDPTVREARQRVTDAYAMRKATGNMYENIKALKEFISRELSRRTSDSSLARRDRNYNT